jgi:hypothetical protein
VAEVVRERGPLLFQVNTRILLAERGRDLGRPATLDDVPDAFLDSAVNYGRTQGQCYAQVPFDRLASC